LVKPIRGIRWSENPLYAFAIGRVKSLETLLFDRSAYERLTRTADLAEFQQELLQSRYGQYAEEKGKNPEQILTRAQSEALNFCLEYAREEWLNVLMALPYYILKTKIILKRQINPNASLETGEWQIKVRLPAAVTQRLRDAGMSALNEAQAKNDPALIDIVLDRVAGEITLNLSQNYDYAHGYYRLFADLLNIRTTLRMKLWNEDANSLKLVLIPGGYLPANLLLELLNTELQSFPNLKPKFTTPLLGNRYWQLVERGLAGFAPCGSLIPLENGIRELLLEYVNCARYVSMGYEPLFRFYRLWENEITNLRLLAGAKLARLDPGKCLELVVYAI